MIMSILNRAVKSLELEMLESASSFDNDVGFKIRGQSISNLRYSDDIVPR